jgi:hypothetical protein
MTKTQTPTLQQFKFWAKTYAPLAEAVLMAQAHAELTRERVDAYIAPILARYAFTADMSDGSVITNADRLYLTNDARVETFYTETYEANRAHGWKGEYNHCPALVAETLLMKAQSALIDAAKPLFGFDSSDLYGADRKKCLDLLLGACVKAGKKAA